MAKGVTTAQELTQDSVQEQPDLGAAASTALARGSDRSRFTAVNIEPAKRRRIEDMIRRGVGIVSTARETGSSATTVQVIRDQLIEREPDLFKRHMAGTLQRIANKTAATIEQSIEQAAEEGLKPNQIPGITIALGIILDKQAALSGETTVQVHEHRVQVDAASITAMLASQNGSKQGPIIDAEVVETVPSKG